MWGWVHSNSNDIGVVFTVLAFLFSIVVLAFSAYRYVSLRKSELRVQRYEQYHELLLKISRGSDDQGALKLVSQRAFIYELRHFPEYRALTIRLLDSLLLEWNLNSDEDSRLTFEVQDTINSLTSRFVLLCHYGASKTSSMRKLKNDK